jgi:hypothetical protein
MGFIKPAIPKILLSLLWLATLLVGLLDVYVSQFIVIWFYTRFLIGHSVQVTAMDIAAFNSVRIAAVLIAAVFYLIFVIATSEYHFKHFSQPNSYRIMGRTIAIELFILVIAYIMGPVTW